MTTTTTASSQARPELRSAPPDRHTAPPRWRERLRATVYAVGLSLVTAALGYLGAWWQGRAELSELQLQLRTAETDHQRSVTELKNAAQLRQKERVQLAELAALYDGLRGARHAVDALDERNFGIAQSRLRAAGEALATVPGPIDGLEAVRHEIAETDVTVAGNLDQQRQQLAELVGRLDALFAKERALRIDLLLDGNVQFEPGAAAPAPSHD